MSLDLDDETREELGWGEAGLDLGAMTVVPRKAKRKAAQSVAPSNPKAMARREAAYQKAYAQTPEGKARRYAAKVAYRRRKRAAMRQSTQEATVD